jgi:SAM-dependent methyltransferase
MIIALTMPIVVLSCSMIISDSAQGPLIAASGVLAIIFVALFASSMTKRLPQLVRLVERCAISQSDFVDNLDPKWVIPAIAAAAGVSIFLELSLIRWQAGELEFYSFYKNFGLLSCVAGLGIGYVLSSRRGVPLALAAPLLALQQVVVVFVRHGFGDTARLSLNRLPIIEQVNMGIVGEPTIIQTISIYFAVTALIILTMLTMVPLGQLCGRLMMRMPAVKAYGWNLLGSLAGIALMVGLSAVLAPPAIWFFIVFATLIAFSYHDKQLTWVGLIATLIGTTALCWKVEFGSERVYSPYQIVQREAGLHGWSEVTAAGLYSQQVMDLSEPSRNAFRELQRPGHYYDFPYTVQRDPDTVAIFGAGMGNDVAAALRNHARNIYAVEIDPCIAAWGRMYHPEKPYADQRVNLVVNDARAFLRQSNQKFDMIVFGLVDSHAMTSHGSSLRMDSYVYTVDALKECRQHLKPGGVLCLSFCLTTVEMEEKLCKMMAEAFGGHLPVCVATDYDGSITYLQNKEATLTNDVIAGTGFLDATPSLSRFQGLDSSTDDWPFFYMPRRIWPISFLPLLTLLVVLTFAMNRSLAGKTSMVISSKNLQFALLGAAFMLIEAKAITQLALNFGNTWQVTGITLAAVLLLAFVGNLLVENGVVGKAGIAYTLLMVTLAAGLALSLSGTFPSTLEGQFATIAILIGPLLFSAMTFSLLISDEKEVGAAMSWNLLGALVGGMLEYTAMYLGYRALHLVALGLYGCAFTLWLRSALMQRRSASTADVSVAIDS